MKKIFVVAVAILSLALLLSACSNTNNQGGSTEDVLSGSLPEIMQQIIAAADYDLPSPIEEDITAENAAGFLGLTADEFTANVESGYVMNAAISAQAHLVALVKCNDADSAATVKQLIADNFDTRRWVCVMPETCFVVDSGRYVLLAATYNDAAAALQTGFASVAGESMGEINTFFSGAN